MTTDTTTALGALRGAIEQLTSEFTAYQTSPGSTPSVADRQARLQAALKPFTGGRDVSLPDLAHVDPRTLGKLLYIEEQITLAGVPVPRESTVEVVRARLEEMDFECDSVRDYIGDAKRAAREELEALAVGWRVPPVAAG